MFVCLKEHQTKLETETLEYSIVLEALCVFGYAVISILISRVGKYVILVFVLGVSGIGGIAAMFTNVPVLQVSCLIAQLCSNMAVNVINAATVEIYPTSSRLILSIINFKLLAIDDIYFVV